MPIDTAVAYNTLIANPTGFLKNYPIRIFGATTASGLVNYAMINRGDSMRPGSILGTRKMHATESFDIRSPAALVAIAPDQPRKLFMAHSIVMNRGGAAAMGFYRLGPGGPAMMVTGQLSGCSFVMIPAGAGQVDVAHVEPRHHQADPMGRAQTGQALHADLSAGMPNAEIYGASGKSKNYDSEDRTASILGVRVAGQWKIFAQKHDRRAGDYRIKSVYQIYPTRQKV